MHGRTTCYYHGGVTTTLGPSSPNYTNGRYSKLLPVRLQQRYEEARVHPRLLSVAEDIAACEARLGDLFQRVDSGESGALWQTLQTTLDGFSTALGERDGATMNRHLATMRRLVTQGRDDYAAWQDIQSLWETRCKLTLTEQKTLVSMQQMITVQQLMVYFGVIVDAINRIVPAYADADSTRAILADLAAEFHRISVLEDGASARA